MKDIIKLFETYDILHCKMSAEEDKITGSALWTRRSSSLGLRTSMRNANLSG